MSGVSGCRAAKGMMRSGYSSRADMMNSLMCATCVGVVATEWAITRETPALSSSAIICVRLPSWWMVMS